MSSDALSLTSLPTEILEQIFRYVYEPWHLEYTQEHDNTTSSHREPKTLHNTLTGEPLFARLPSNAPLLITKSLYQIASPIFTTSFSGQVHITSRLRWKTVHASYEGVMKCATSLVFDIDSAWSFVRLNFLEKLPVLKEVNILLPGYAQYIASYSMEEGQMRVLKARSNLGPDEHFPMYWQAKVDKFYEYIIGHNQQRRKNGLDLVEVHYQRLMPAKLLDNGIEHRKRLIVHYKGAPNDLRFTAVQEVKAHQRPITIWTGEERALNDFFGADEEQVLTDFLGFSLSDVPAVERHRMQ